MHICLHVFEITERVPVWEISNLVSNMLEKNYSYCTHTGYEQLGFMSVIKYNRLFEFYLKTIVRCLRNLYLSDELVKVETVDFQNGYLICFKVSK